MSRQPKAYKNLNCKIDAQTFEMLESFIEETKLSKTATVEKALQAYIKEYTETGRI